MHPALSVIFFTTASGAGYGLVLVVSVMALAGALPADAAVSATALLFATVLISAGLLSSLAHLGHPERAWRALSQWRSSWLSREGVLAMVTFVPIGALAVVLVKPEYGALTVRLAALCAATAATATVFSTAMIYASLRPIRQWHNPYVPAVYLSFAVMTGAIWAAALLSLWRLPAVVAGSTAIAAMLVAWGLKGLYWRHVSKATPRSTLGSATGLAGKVSVFDPPHTERNYLLREMGFQVARRHRRRLRQTALITGLIVPLALLAAQLAWQRSLTPWLTLPAALILTLGVIVERWLFFAEAEHTVTLYYRR